MKRFRYFLVIVLLFSFCSCGKDSNITIHSESISEKDEESESSTEQPSESDSEKENISAAEEQERINEWINYAQENRFRSANELATHRYSDEEIQEMYHELYQLGLSASSQTLLETDERYPIQCIRLINRFQQQRLSVIYSSEGLVLTVPFDTSGEMTLELYVYHPVDEEEFDQLVQIGTTWKEIIEKYPDGEYIWLELDNTYLLPATATFVTTNGKFIELFFEGDSEQENWPYCVAEIRKSLL